MWTSDSLFLACKKFLSEIFFASTRDVFSLRARRSHPLSVICTYSDFRVVINLPSRQTKKIECLARPVGTWGTFDFQFFSTIRIISVLRIVPAILDRKLQQGSQCFSVLTINCDNLELS